MIRTLVAVTAALMIGGCSAPGLPDGGSGGGTGGGGASALPNNTAFVINDIGVSVTAFPLSTRQPRNFSASRPNATLLAIDEGRGNLVVVGDKPVERFLMKY